MKYNFDKIIDRSKTNSRKWNPELYKDTYHGKKDLLPLWVADMDFRVAPPILRSMNNIIEHGILGYSVPEDEYYNSIIDWNAKRKNCRIEKDWIIFANGVVPALNYMIQTFTKEGDSILIQTPVYNPFRVSTENNGRKIVETQLIDTNGYYTVDYEDFERKIVENNIKIFILCNPHNPVGRVWKREELEKMGEICLKHDVLIIADEIHSDLIFKEYSHCSFLTLREELKNICIVCSAPSKTFNLAGLHTSFIFIANPELKAKYKETMMKIRLEAPNIFGIAAVTAAYTKSGEWLDELIEYLDGNRKYIEEYLKENIPEIKYVKPEGTYLAWLDFSEFLKDGHTLEEIFEERAKVAIDYGNWFGKIGENYIRLNFACPRSVLKEALDRIKKAVK